MNSNKVAYWINSNKSYITLHYINNMYINYICYHIKFVHIRRVITKNEVHSVTFILHEGIQYHNSYSWFSIIHVPKYGISHYITLRNIWVAPSNYNNCFTSEMVNSNWLNTRTQTFTRHFYCSIQKIKFLLGLV